MNEHETTGMALVTPKETQREKRKQWKEFCSDD